MAKSRGAPKTGGRRKGTPNKNTALIKGMIVEALDKSGGVDYLVGVAKNNPAAFCTLIGKVLPLNHTSEDATLSPPTEIRIVGVSAANALAE
jgi:hypothetical protein